MREKKSVTHTPFSSFWTGRGGGSQYTNSYIKSEEHYFLYKLNDLILEWGEKVH